MTKQYSVSALMLFVTLKENSDFQISNILNIYSYKIAYIDQIQKHFEIAVPNSHWLDNEATL